MTIWENSSFEDGGKDYIRECSFCGTALERLPGSLPNVEILPDDGLYNDLVYICPRCGWWHATYLQASGQGTPNVYHTLYTSKSVLKKMDISESPELTDEIYQYLNANWKDRLKIPPRMMEEVVKGVYENIGYSVELTSYQKDGGIDLYILRNGDRVSGVQVKRSKNVIGVDQIRSFAGALIIDGLDEGVFVTTSSFTGPAMNAVKSLAQKDVRIELLDSRRLYDCLGLKRINCPSSYNEWESQNQDIKYWQQLTDCVFVSPD